MISKSHVDFEVAAVKAGLVFTPQQLEEVRSRLPVYMEDEALVEWLLSLTVGSETQQRRLKLVDQCPFESLRGRSKGRLARVAAREAALAVPT